MSTPMMLADLISEPGPPCWARSATGIAIALVLWLGFLGARATLRRHREGQVMAARMTGVGVAVGVLAGFAIVWIVYSAIF